MSEDPGRLLGVDLGQVRIGLAIADARGLTTRPLASLERRGPSSDARRVAGVAAEEGAGTVVVGLPLLLSGAHGEESLAAREFARNLAAAAPGLRVELWDERLSTVEVERTLIAADVRRDRRKQSRDGLAAALILRGYLDSRPARLEPA